MITAGYYEEFGVEADMPHQPRIHRDLRERASTKKRLTMNWNPAA